MQGSKCHSVAGENRLYVEFVRGKAARLSSTGAVKGLPCCVGVGGLGCTLCAVGSCWTSFIGYRVRLTRWFLCRRCWELCCDWL